MSKDPAFLFYSGDFLAGVSDLTMEERGQYITLLCLQHQKGHLTDKMIRLCCGNAAADVMVKFAQDESGLYYSKRLDIEIEKRREHSAKQRQRAIDGWEKRKNNTNAAASAVAIPLENENVNDNINKVTSIKKVSRKKTVELSDASADIMDWFISEFDNVAYDWSASAKTKARQGIDYAIKRLQNKPENKELNFDELVWLLKMTITFIKKDNFWHDKLESPAKLMTSDKSGLNWLDRFVAMYRMKSPELKQQATIDEVGRNVAEWIKGKEERERAEKEKIY